MAPTLIIDGKVSIGRPPAPSSLGQSGEEWTSFQFHFHNFADLSTIKEHFVDSPEFTCNGHQWRLEVYPGGDINAAEGRVSVCLFGVSGESITTTYRIDILDKFGTSRKINQNAAEFSREGGHWCGRGWDLTRSYILDESKNILDSDGTLTIVVSIEDEPTNLFVPNNPFLGLLNDMFNDESSADVRFELVHSCADEKEGGGNKKLKASVSFHAHRLILRKCAPMLVDLLGSNDTATITDIKPDVFHHLLYYVYGGEVPKEDLKTHAKEIINATDKYSIVNLKLAAEAAYVESTDITFDNAMDDLLYADAKNCALLKEKVMHFLADNHLEAAEWITFTDCPGHVVKDLLIVFGRGRQNGSTETNADELTSLSVNKLRRKLHKLGLEVDGSREAMIESIKSHSSVE